jgi:O-antigen ligase
MKHSPLIIRKRRLVSVVAAFREAYLVLGLLILSKAFVVFFAGSENGGDDEAQNPMILQALFLASFVFVVLFFLKNPKRMFRAAWQEPVLLLLVLYAASSFLWSDVPSLALRRGVVVLMGTVFGLYLAAAFPYHILFRMFTAACIIATLASIITMVVLPDLAAQPLIGGWRGIYPNKNALGRMTALGALSCILLARQLPRYRKWMWIGAGALFAVTILSQSMTSFISLLLLIGMMGIFTLIRRSNWLVIPVIVIAALGILLLAAISIVAFSDQWIALLGRDPDSNTLFTRFDLWRLVSELIAERPLLGYGLASFWLGWDGPSASIWRVHGWGPNHAHNGFLDLGLELGLVGMALSILLLLTNLYWAIQFHRRYRTPVSMWPALYFSYLLLTNFAYSMFLSQTIFFWTLFVATSCSMLLTRSYARVHHSRTISVLTDHQLVSANPSTGR